MSYRSGYLLPYYKSLAFESFPILKLLLLLELPYPILVRISSPSYLDNLMLLLIGRLLESLGLVNLDLPCLP